MRDDNTTSRPIWPEREMTFIYGSREAYVQWRLRSACSGCGAPLDATGDAWWPGAPFAQDVHCGQCGVSYTVEGQIDE